MRLYIVRHGEAKSAFEDPNKGLSEFGREQAKKIGGFLQDYAAGSGEIWHSNKQRAIDTAEVLNTFLGKEMVQMPWLTPNSDPGDLIDALNGEENDLIVVSHLPYVNHLVSTLVCNRQFSDPVIFGNCTTVCLYGEHGKWHIEWVVSPGNL